MTRRPDAGFTLIETLVAMSILAMSGVALMGAVEAHVVRIGALEQRAAAQWVAENHLADLALGLNAVTAPPPVRGYGFDVATAMAATADPDLLQVQITVTDAATGRSHAVLTGFLISPGTASP